MKLLPRNPAPNLSIDLLHGAPWSLENQSANYMTMLVVYRGYHCPVCKNYLKELQKHQGAFNKLGVEILAVSADTHERASLARDEWAVEKLAIGFGLTREQMDEWGLYVSESIKDAEPPVFAEPGLFLLKPDGTIFYAAYNSMPFGRPPIEDMLNAVKFIKKNDYPARGEQPRRAVAGRS